MPSCFRSKAQRASLVHFDDKRKERRMIPVDRNFTGSGIQNARYPVFSLTVKIHARQVPIYSQPERIIKKTVRPL